MRSRTRIITPKITAFALALLCFASFASAQYQVHQPGEVAHNASGTNAATTQAWDRAPGVELYGNNQNKTARYTPQIVPLPSETRMAIERSGALPSEIRMNAEAAGPLTPHGAMDYVPTQSPLQKAFGTKPLNLWGPAWQTPLTDGVTAPIQNPGGAVPPPRRATGDPSPLEVTPRPVNTQVPFDARIQTAPLGQPTAVNSTVTRRLIRPNGPPTTRPADQSLSNQFPAQPEPATQPPAK